MLGGRAQNGVSCLGSVRATLHEVRQRKPVALPMCNSFGLHSLRFNRPRTAVESEEPEMTQINLINTTQTARYETPAFDPRMAFSWTLRSAELAARRRRNAHQDPTNLERSEIDTDLAIRDDVASAPAARYETPTFDPRMAFSWTLRSEEIARSKRRLPAQLSFSR